MASTPFVQHRAMSEHPIHSLLGQSDSPDNPAKQLVAAGNKEAIISTSLKVLTSLVNQVWEFTNETWAEADKNFAIAFHNVATLEKRVVDLEHESKALANLPDPADSHA